MLGLISSSRSLYRSDKGSFNDKTYGYSIQLRFIRENIAFATNSFGINFGAPSLIHFLDTLQEFFQYDEMWILFLQSLQSDRQLWRYWFHQMALRFEYFCLLDCHDLLLEGLNQSRAHDFPIGLISLGWSRSQRNIWKNHKVIQKEFRYFLSSTIKTVSVKLIHGQRFWTFSHKFWLI